ncbi:MAG: FtsQ-type POTRA domain-containing protein [Lentisphaeria bacterium]|nr:FtsQ-type POTRA domain-containing protein [Lentisphaeria bacterium]
MPRKKTTDNLPLTLTGTLKAERAIRYTIGAVLCLIAGAGLFIAGRLVNQHFYRANPHFALVNIDTNPTPNYSSNRVLTILSEMGIEIGRNNLMNLKLKAIHDRLASEPLVKTTEVRRILPDTLQIRLTERVPAAMLHCIPPFNIDPEGVILPYQIKDVPDTLPHITGVRNPSLLVPGQKTDDQMMAAALRLLQLVRVRPDGRNLDIALIQLDYQQRRLRLIVRALPFSPVFRSGAQVLVPVNGMNAALDRLNDIVLHKIKTNGTISVVDVTYEHRINVIP